MIQPRIGITSNCVLKDEKICYQVAHNYCSAVVAAGGEPVLMTCEIEVIPEYIGMCQGFVFTGGDDPLMEDFGEMTHTMANPVLRPRQDFELGLLDALCEKQSIPVLGICFGMQLLALHAGGKLDQHLPEVMDHAQAHVDNREHDLVAVDGGGDIYCGATGTMSVVSSHHQAVSDPGSMRVVARSSDGVIEGIDDPGRNGGQGFYIGAQYHPERSDRDDSRPVNQGLFDRLIQAASQISR